MTTYEKVFAIAGLLLLCLWAVSWMVDDWIDDRNRKD